MRDLGECLAQMEKEVLSASPGNVKMAAPIAAALVAVVIQAQRSSEPWWTESSKEADQGVYHATIASRRDDMGSALNALAMLLGAERRRTA